MNKRILSVVLVALLAVALVVGAITVSAADVTQKTPMQDRYGDRGGNIKLAEDIGLSNGLTVKENKSLTIDLDGWTLGGLSANSGDITVEKGATLTINDGYKDGEVTGTITVEAGGKLVVNGGKVANVVTEGTKDNKASVTVSGGTITTATVEENTSITVESGKVTTLNVTTGTADVKGGTVTTLNVGTKGDANVTGGRVDTVTGDGEVNINGTEAVVVNIKGTVEVLLEKGYIRGEVGQNIDLTVDGRDLNGAIVSTDISKVDSVRVVNGYILKTGDNETVYKNIADKRAAIAVYENAYINEFKTGDKDNKILDSATWYVYGERTIENLKLDSYTNYADTVNGKVVENKTDDEKKAHTKNDVLDIQVNPDDTIELKVTGYANVIVKKADDLKEKVYVNGYELGSKLQPGKDKPIYDWATTSTPATDAGKRDCSKEYVLQTYFADNNKNADAYGKPGTDGKLADIYVIADDKDGPVVGNGHQLTFVPAKSAASAKEPGYDAHYYCKNCGKYFAGEVVTMEGFDGLKNVDAKKAAAYEIENPIARNPIPETTVAPAETTKAPAETTAAPAETTKAPAETTAAPAETTKAPAETTAAPAETQAPSQVTPSETGDNGMNALVWVIVLGAAVTGVAVAGKSVLASKKH